MPPSPPEPRAPLGPAPDRAGDLAADPAEADLLAVVAAVELSAFLRLAALASTGPTLADVRGLARVAVDHLARHERVADHLSGLGVDVAAAVDPWRTSLEAFHRRLAPSTWGETVVGACVGDAVTSDVCAALAAGAGPDTSALVRAVLGPPPPGAPDPHGADGDRPAATAPGGSAAPSVLDEEVAAFAVPALARVVAADPRATDRLSLWGRRLVGEALGQAQAVLVARPGLQRLLEGSQRSGTVSRAPVADAFARVTRAHVGRMARLGLAA